MTELVFEKDFNLTESVWTTFGRHQGEKLPPAHKHRWIEKARGAHGEWTIDPHERSIGSDVSKIKYQPFHPDGLDFAGIRAEIQRLEAVKEYRQDRRQIEFLRHMYGSTIENGYAETQNESRMLCQALEIPSDDLPPFDEALAELGFMIKTYDNRLWTRAPNYLVYERTIKSGTFDLVIRNPEFEDQDYGDIHCTYNGHGVNHWHNVFHLDADCRGHGDKNYRCYFFWPPTATDLRRNAVEHLKNVIEKRMARERTRLSTPL